MISTTQQPKNKTELLRALQKTNFDFSVEEIATASDRQKLNTKLDAALRKSSITILIIREK
jgi:hypothetical protein|tara:strand:- start:661 stop:843 length:183 start_codon:yes stop_codon:yes gene_type:complete